MKSIEKKKKNEEEKREGTQKRSLLKVCIYMGDEVGDRFEKNRIIFPGNVL